MNIQHTFARNMKALRQKQGLTQEKLSEKCELHRTYIGGIEQERINVSLKNIGKIAHALNVNPAYFFIDFDTPEEHDVENNAANDTGAAKEHRTSDFEKAQPHSNTVYYLCIQNGTRLNLEPIEVDNIDVTLQILASLIEQGHDSKDLAQNYTKTKNELLRYFYLEENNHKTPNEK